MGGAHGEGWSVSRASAAAVASDVPANGAAWRAASFAFTPSTLAQVGSFRFGLTPVFLSNDLELLGHLRAYLEAKLGGPVELVSRRTYQEITALLVSGQVHAAWICGYPYVQFRDKLELVATPSWQGRRSIAPT
jgi:phosphonate transport system substrate-binding protein